MKKVTLVGALLVLLGVPGASHTATSQRETQSMSFDACLAAKAQKIASLQVRPQDIVLLVNTSDLTISQICTAEGSMLITCNRSNHQMVTTQFPHSADTGCVE